MRGGTLQDSTKYGLLALRVCVFSGYPVTNKLGALGAVLTPRRLRNNPTLEFKSHPLISFC
jgi:hypothetical protein